jgi:DNA-binding HxlR family transcriptional regulator
MNGESPRNTRAAVRGSTSGRPIMAAMDLLGRRWALRILWELRDGSLGARALRERCDGMSSSVLYERLRELAGAGLIVQTTGNAYSLTTTGASLGQALHPLNEWAVAWVKTRDGRVTSARPKNRPHRS